MTREFSLPSWLTWIDLNCHACDQGYKPIKRQCFTSQTFPWSKYFIFLFKGLQTQTTKVPVKINPDQSTWQTEHSSNLLLQFNNFVLLKEETYIVPIYVVPNNALLFVMHGLHWHKIPKNGLFGTLGTQNFILCVRILTIILKTFQPGDLQTTCTR